MRWRAMVAVLPLCALLVGCAGAGAGTGTGGCSLLRSLEDEFATDSDATTAWSDIQALQEDVRARLFLENLVDSEC